MWIPTKTLETCSRAAQGSRAARQSPAVFFAEAGGKWRWILVRGKREREGGVAVQTREDLQTGVGLIIPDYRSSPAFVQLGS